MAVLTRGADRAESAEAFLWAAQQPRAHAFHLRLPAPNTELGDPNDTACHFDLPMRGCSLYLEDEVIVDAGEPAVPEMRPAGKR